MDNFDIDKMNEEAFKQIKKDLLIKKAIDVMKRKPGAEKEFRTYLKQQNQIVLKSKE